MSDCANRENLSAYSPTRGTRFVLACFVDAYTNPDHTANNRTDYSSCGCAAPWLSNRTSLCANFCSFARASNGGTTNGAPRTLALAVRADQLAKSGSRWRRHTANNFRPPARLDRSEHIDPTAGRSIPPVVCQTRFNIVVLAGEAQVVGKRPRTGRVRIGDRRTQRIRKPVTEVRLSFAS